MQFVHTEVKKGDVITSIFSSSVDSLIKVLSQAPKSKLASTVLNWIKDATKAMTYIHEHIMILLLWFQSSNLMNLYCISIVTDSLHGLHVSPSNNKDPIAEARNSSSKICGTDAWDWQGVSNLTLSLVMSISWWLSYSVIATFMSH